MSDSSRKVVRGGCLGSVLGAVLGAILFGVVAGAIRFVLAKEDPGPHVIPLLHPSRSDTAFVVGFLAAFPGAFVGAVVGAIRGTRNAAANSSESSEDELARLRKEVEELKDKKGS